MGYKINKKIILNKRTKNKYLYINFYYKLGKLLL